MRTLAIISSFATLIASQASALTLADCKRTTHPSHGGEIRHTDLGEGRVMWMDWWSQEGTAKGFALVECASGEMLRLRSAEENMGRRSAFDRTDEALEVLERHQSGTRAFATFERIAADTWNLSPVTSPSRSRRQKTAPVQRPIQRCAARRQNLGSRAKARQPRRKIGAQCLGGTNE